MSFLEKLCGSVLFSLMLTAGAFAAEPGAVAAKYQGGGGGALKGEARGSPLPATFVAGDATRFDAAKAGPVVAKARDGGGSLPSAVRSGEGAAYAAGDGAGPSASKAVKRAGPVGVSKP